MRFIDTSTFTPPATWAAKVLSATAHFNATGEFRSIWKDLAEELNSIIRIDKQRKCWYSEIIIKGSDVDVDHFRPKSNSKALTKKFAELDVSLWAQIDQTDRAGYPFLAFEWSNFRLSSQHSNQGRQEGEYTKGKQDFFPLRLLSPIAALIGDLDKEQVCLLDPCKKEDPSLLKFSTDGMVDASYPGGSWEYCRAKVSIEVYHLNFNLRGLVDARLEKWNECTREIDFLLKLYPTKREELILEQQRKIIQLAKRESEFSAVAIDCIRHLAKKDEYLNIRPIADALKK